MIKKGCLFSLVVFCSLFFLTACQSPQGSTDPELVIAGVQNVPFDALKETGFIPPVIRLQDSYVNDKIESKAKKLSYEFYYYALVGNEDFPKITTEKAFSYLIHTATIAEEDAGDASKTKIKYDKLKAVNGGDICVGTKFVLGLRVKDQSDNLVYHTIMKYVVWAPKAQATDDTGEIAVSGDQRGFGGTISVVGDGDINESATVFKDGKTIYKLTNASGKYVALKFDVFGETNRVLVK